MPSTRPCLICQEPTFGTIHNHCRRERNFGAYEKDVALTGGEWVPADGIMRWVADGLAS